MASEKVWAEAEQIMKQLLAANRTIADLTARAERAERERDEAIAERDHLTDHGITEDYVHGLRDDLSTAEAELATLRPVVDAARAWRKGHGRIAYSEIESEVFAQWRQKDATALAAAVDALTTTEETP